MRRALAALTLLTSVVACEVWAGERVDLELVLLADASRSIDDAEIMFQRRGYAVAITDRAVLSAITRGGYEGRIAVTYVEWGDESSQEVVVPWTIVDGPKSAAAFARALLERPRLALYQRTLISTCFMAAHRPPGQARRAARCRASGKCRNALREAEAPHRRPRSFARSRRCDLLVVRQHHGTGRALRAGKITTVKQADIKVLWY